MGAPYIYDISRLRVKDLHSATYIYVVRRLRINKSNNRTSGLLVPSEARERRKAFGANYFPIL